MANEYVRVCPVCETENPPEHARCACGASLAGIDFSLKRAPAPADVAPDAVATPAGITPAETAARESPGAAPLVLPRADSPPASPGAVASRIGTPSVSASPSPSARAAADAASGNEPLPADAGAQADPASIVCPYPDCAQSNAPDRERCVYCNRPLRASAPAIAGARPLPSALRDEYSVVDVFPATGSEADILLVADVRTGERRVAKLYRRGIAPDFRLLDILARTVGDAVVHVFAHGVSDGAAYELLEYVPGGTLEDLLRSGPLPLADVRRIVREIADALNGIHAHRILHRDLKPENVLIRSASPLELALTDFGIASLAAATQHFTSAARTTKYAAPEVLTGVLDAKSDWWSLGMIVLEAASGAHPFDGLSEQVMNHHLATRPIDVRGIYDDELRMLCRGLLLRDPKRRWGGDEVARWLAADPTLTVAEDADGTASSVHPYRFGKTEATTGAELALALAKHWDAARRDLARGQVARWLEQELHDHNLLRILRDLQERKDASDDARLLHFLLAAAPDLPPVWRGSPVVVDAVLARAREAAQGDAAAQAWLDSLARDRVLEIFAAAGHAELGALERRWRAGWKAFVEVWEVARRAEEQWRQQPRDVGGGEDAAAVSFDDLAFTATGRLVAPSQSAVNGALLLALTDPAYVETLRGEVTGGLAQVAGFCPWFDALWERSQRDGASVLATRLLLPHAQDDAAMEARRQSATADARARMRDEARDDLRARVSELLVFIPTGDEDLAATTVSQLLESFDGFQHACQNVLRLGQVDVEYDALRRTAEKLSSLGFAAQRALTESEEIQGVNAIFLTPQRMLAGVVILGAALLLRVPVAFLLVLAIAAAAIGYRWYVGFHATEAALAKLRLFGLHARTFLRSNSPSAGERAEGEGG